MFPWRNKRLTYEYHVPDEILGMENPVVFYPAAGKDPSLVEKLTGMKMRIIYQDIAYGKDAGLIDPAYVSEFHGDGKMTEFIEMLSSKGVEVITDALRADSLQEKADLVLLRSLFGFLFQNNLAELILANCKEGALITGCRFDLDGLCLMYDGLERISQGLLRVRAGHAQSKLQPWLTQFPELSFWALKGSFRTYSGSGFAEKKFKRMGQAMVDRELESAAPGELDAYFKAMPPKLYPRYLRRHLKERGLL